MSHLAVQLANKGPPCITTVLKIMFSRPPRVHHRGRKHLYLGVIFFANIMFDLYQLFNDAFIFYINTKAITAVDDDDDDDDDKQY